MNPRMPAGKPRHWIGVTLLAYALYLPVAAGFVLHTDPATGPRVFGKYSPGYALFLVVVLLPLVPMPWLARRLTRPMRVGRRKGGGDRGGPDRDAPIGEVVIDGWRRAGFAAARALLGLLIAVTLAEVGFRIYRAVVGERVEVRLQDWDPFFEWWPLRAGEVNRWGWQGPQVTVVKPAGTFRIVALGGSTTFLSGMVDAEDNFVSRLRRSLASTRPAWRVEVINAACHSHTTIQSLVKYATLIQDFEPDVVLIMHGVNDLDQGSGTEMGPWKGPYQRDYAHDARRSLRRLSRESATWRPQSAIWMRLEVGRRLAQALDRVFYSDLRWGGRLSEEERRRLAEDRLLTALPAFRRNLRTLGQLVQADGARFVVAAQPTMYRPDAPAGTVFGYHTPEDAGSPIWRGRPDIFSWACVQAMHRYNETARDVAADLRATFVHLERAVPPQWAYFQAEVRDGVHLNEAGCALVAQALEAAILPLIPDQPPVQEPASRSG